MSVKVIDVMQDARALPIVQAALAEDLGDAGDVTTRDRKSVV